MTSFSAEAGNFNLDQPVIVAEIGYTLAIYSSITGLAAGATIENASEVFKAEGASASPNLPLYDFREFQSRIGFEDV